MTYRVIFADVANRALASSAADDRRAVYASLNDLRHNPQPNTATSDVCTPAG